MNSPVPARWSLGAKLAAVGLPFLLLGLLTTALTLWVSWQLDGGAAAVNEAGRMRMQAYRLAWTGALGQQPQAHQTLIAGFDHSLDLLARGDSERPLVMPWDATVRARYHEVVLAWASLRQLHQGAVPVQPSAAVDEATVHLVQRIDALVSAVEVHLARYTSVLHLLQVGLLVLGTLAASVLVVVGYHFVLEPVAGLKHAVSQLQGGDLSARVEPSTSDELGALAAGFNDMATRLQASYAGLEDKVREKTAELQRQHERLEALYGREPGGGRRRQRARDGGRPSRAACGAWRGPMAPRCAGPMPRVRSSCCWPATVSRPPWPATSSASAAATACAAAAAPMAARA
jgi:two-component system nitrate/nitrite sensor histidine kinase NarX